jgi:hemerythrin-like domain-containing protein
MGDETMPDVFEVLGAAHREVEQMLDRMQAMIGPPGQPAAALREQGGWLADALISAVSQHEAAEERYLWPVVKEKVSDGNSLAASGVEQETEGKKVLAELDGMAPGDERFVPLMTKFAHAARAHIAYEEQQVWPGLGTVLSADEAADLGEKLAKATKAGPTRPHPHVPPSPAALKAASPAVAAADKLRDAASGRGN